MQIHSIDNDIKAVNKIPAVRTILEVICRTTQMGFAAVARVTDDKWVACAVKDDIQFGLKPGGELRVETTFCHEIHHTRQAVVIDHVDTDEVYCKHHTPAMYGFQSYISVPIILQDGSFFGTLCAIDPKPARLKTVEIIGMFNMFAELLAFHLSAIEEMTETRQHLLEERQISELREQFIAILGHDLRNPIGAVSGSAQLLLTMPLDEQSKKLVSIIQNSTFRVDGLIENMLDFARGRLGGGLTLRRKDSEPIDKILMQVISELRVIWPQREIKTTFTLNEPVNCDGRRLAQLFSNLLANALKFGKQDEPVEVEASSEKAIFRLSVANACKPIPPVVMLRLFQPYYRAEITDQQGLGLGLYISSEIAKAHGGTIDVSSTEEVTKFVLEFPG